MQQNNCRPLFLFVARSTATIYVAPYDQIGSIDVS